MIPVPDVVPLNVNVLAAVVKVPAVSIRLPEINFELFKMTFVPEF